MKLEMKDFEFGNLPDGYDKSKLVPQDLWSGPWIESLDEYGNKVLVPAIDYKESDFQYHFLCEDPKCSCNAPKTKK